jgi:two-component system response regulator AlgR
MRALVVDDEAPARRRLADLLEELGVEVAGEAANGLDALALARDRRPDVVFLDVSMPEVDGFDVARHLAEPRPLIVFQTAYSEFAVNAFEHDALDYLVKPVTRERLAQALDRVERRTAAAPRWDAPDLASFGMAIGHVATRPERLLVRHANGHRLVPVAEIERFGTDDGLVYAHVPDSTTLGKATAIETPRPASVGVHGTDYTLNELEERLRGAFVRASRSDLVALTHIVGITSNGDGSATLALRSGETVHVSRRRSAAVRALLDR